MVDLQRVGATGSEESVRGCGVKGGRLGICGGWYWRFSNSIRLEENIYVLDGTLSHISHKTFFARGREDGINFLRVSDIYMDYRRFNVVFAGINHIPHDYRRRNRETVENGKINKEVFSERFYLYLQYYTWGLHWGIPNKAYFYVQKQAKNEEENFHETLYSQKLESEGCLGN